jgi:hypothetical protein
MSTSPDEDWIDYYNDRLCRVHKDGFYVIIPKEEMEVIPLACPVCGYLYRSLRDEESHSEFECCDQCAMEHMTESDSREKWVSGCRPTSEVVQKSISLRRRPTVKFEF